MIYAYIQHVNSALSLPLVVVHSSLNLPLHMYYNVNLLCMCSHKLNQHPAKGADDIKLNSVHNNHLAQLPSCFTQIFCFVIALLAFTNSYALTTLVDFYVYIVN